MGDMPAETVPENEAVPEERACALAVDRLRHGYAGRVVLDDVSLRLRAGTTLALVGRNGSGKSTLLRCIVGTEPVPKGTVRVFGRSADDTDPTFRRDVAAVLDDLDFFPDLTVSEHLDLLARAHGVPDPESAVVGVLDDLRITDAADQFPGTLSSGQRRRLALGAAFVRPCRLLVLDEPEQRLDPAGRAWLADRLRAYAEDGVAVVFASHAPDLVDAVADDVFQVDQREGADDPTDWAAGSEEKADDDGDMP